MLLNGNLWLGLGKTCGNLIDPAGEPLYDIVIDTAIPHGLGQPSDIRTQVGQPVPGFEGLQNTASPGISSAFRLPKPATA